MRTSHPTPFSRLLLSGALFIALASACSLPAGLVQDTSGTPTASFTPIASLTQAATTSLPGSLPSDATVSPVTAASTLPPPATTLEVPCNLALPGNPIDVTVPDDTRLTPGESFLKIWRLVNGGSCTWTIDYSLVWYGGEDFDAQHSQPLSLAVQPDRSVEIAIDLVAPETPGVYTGYWMLASDQGELFGIGPDGKSPFWVRVQVVSVETAVPTATVTPSPTPIVLASGAADMLPGQSIDLDTGQLDQPELADASFEGSGVDDLQWLPQNNSRFAVFGLNQPESLDCQLATLTDASVSITSLIAGTYLCYRTSEGLPGRLQIVNLPGEGIPLQINFITWAVP